MTAIPFGACHCGCGGQTNLTTQNDTTRGYVKGEPRLYIRGHHSRGKIKGTPEERFWPKIEKTDDCWNWTAFTGRDGYGRHFIKVGLYVPAHRFAYELMVGPIPEGLQLDHLCRNRRCVRPDHLEPVTQAENIRRGLKGRMVTHCPQGHAYDEENTYIRRSGGRYCRACGAASHRRRKRARRLEPAS